MLFIACRVPKEQVLALATPHSSDGVFGDKQRRLLELWVHGRPRLRETEVIWFAFSLLLLLRRLLIIV
jgi:hypothetical protein